MISADKHFPGLQSYTKPIVEYCRSNSMETDERAGDRASALWNVRDASKRPAHLTYITFQSLASPSLYTGV